MDLTPPPRLPANLESAVQRVRMAARSAAEHTVDSLGLAALATHHVMQRDALLGAQYELNRKLAIFALVFNETLDTDVARQAGTLTPTPGPGGPSITPESLVANWESLTLVDDHEVEIHISADRFALEISHACEWEIRELDAYIGSLLGLGAADHDRNPLRAEVVGQAMIRAVQSVSDRPEVRKVLSTEIGRSLAHAMRHTYAEVVADLRKAGVRPIGLTVRNGPARSGSVHGGLRGSAGQETAEPSAQGRLTGPHEQASARAGFATSTRSGAGAGLGRVDAEMMLLIRRLAQGSGGAGHDADDADAGYAEAGDGHAAHRPPAPNMILAHREALRQVATSTLDHRVIDVIAGLFEQILSDAKVPPQVVRQIARLQLPVLRAALGDNTFFSSRRHPVRRFVNRIASLGSAVDDLDGDEGRALLDKVASLVQEVVDGDFEQITVYEQKLQALEAFISAQSHERVRALGAADELLARKEQGLRVQQRYAHEMDVALQGLPVPAYLRDFLAATWSRAIASAALEFGNDAELTQRLRDAGRELVTSVQPKGSPERRQQFLRKLPQLMKDLNLGLDRIGHPEAARRAFFAELLPAHAESLKGQAPSTLEHNLLARRVDTALAMAVPKVADLPAPVAGATQTALAALATPGVFSAAEARAVGLLDDAAVDWARPVDIDLAADAELTAVDINIDGLPAPEPVEPTRGKSLAEHLQIGLAYQMQLQGEWQKVRLSHVSPARSFFVFTHGARHRGTVAMTQRMLVKLCDAGRLRALENACLLERATARARRQLAAVAPKKR